MAWGLTFPLITKADGTKFGKTEGGAVWLDPEKTSPYRFYQFFINTEDSMVVEYLKKFTLLSREQIEPLAAEHAGNPGARAAQKALAREVTILVHGKSACDDAVRASEIMFGGGLGGITEAMFKDVVGEIPTTELDPAKLAGAGATLADLLVLAGSVSLQEPGAKRRGSRRRLPQQHPDYRSRPRHHHERSAVWPVRAPAQRQADVRSAAPRLNKGVSPVLVAASASEWPVLEIDRSIQELYKDYPLGRTGGGLEFINLMDDYLAYLSFANAGMLNKGNLLCFDYAIRNLPSKNPMVEIGSFSGLSTNIMTYFKRKHCVENELFTCDKWEFEGADGNVGESDISHVEYREFVKAGYIRNVKMFSRSALPRTIELLSDDFFSAGRGKP